MNYPNITYFSKSQPNKKNLFSKIFVKNAKTSFQVLMSLAHNIV